MQLRASLRSLGDETNHCAADLHGVLPVRNGEQLAERGRLQLWIVRTQLELRQTKLLVLLEQLVEPFARWMQLEPVARVRGDKGAPPTVFLDPKLPHLRARERLHELVLVEREAEVIDARQLPLTRLDDDVDCAALELRQPELEPYAIQVLPAVACLEGGHLLADPAVSRDQVEAELADVARLDLSHLARHQVIVEELHTRRLEAGGGESGRLSVRSTGVHHVDLVVSSITRSLPFYTDLLGPLGFTRIEEVEGERGETIWYLSGPGSSVGLREAQSGQAHDRYAIGLHHLAFEAESRTQVDQLGEWVRSQAVEIESEPQEYTYLPGYYAVFFYDPDGIKLEIVYVPGLVAA